MSQLAIKGHATRGREVIKLLEMLGGRNMYKYNGDDDNTAYFIDGLYITAYKCEYINREKYSIFTLEQFLKNFPYKVGDKVKSARINDIVGIIKEAQWESNVNEVVYDVECDDMRESYLPYFANGLQPYKEENYCQVIGNDTSSNGINTSASSINKEPEPKAPILSNRYDYAEGKCGYVIPDGYEFDYIKEGFQTEIILKPKKPTYPKDYKECCEVLGYSGNYNMILTTDIDCKLFNALYRLKVCRDAYWKIAGEYMGLDKPWKPDYDSGVNKYGIISMNGAVQKSNPTTNWERHLNKVLEFPTEEMRDAFFENFKDLIEQCKELL